MELTGEQKLALPRARVWSALNDPAVLKRCLPGCDVFDRERDELYKVGMVASVGPVKARFNGKLTLSDIVPPTSYALAFEGSGGAAGFGKGNARVTLSDGEAGATVLSYTVTAQVGGRLAQVGARLIDGVAKKMADEFFTRFAKTVTSESVPSDAAGMGATEASAALAGSVPSTPPSPSTSPVASTAQAPVSAQAPNADSVPAPVLEPTSVPVPTTAAAFAPPVAQLHPSHAAPVASADSATTRHIAVLAAAISAIGAAVAVLAAAVAIHATR